MGCLQSRKVEENFLLQSLQEHERGINSMAISEDGSVLATGGEDKIARLWSTKTEQCECIGVLRGHTDYINCILIEDCYVLTGSADKTMRKWDVGTCECLLILTGHSSVIYRMICTGDFIFSSSYDRTARAWDFESGECVRVFRGHKRGVYPLIFIPAEQEDEELDLDTAKDILITGSADFTARTWNFETGQLIKVMKGHTGAVTCMSVDPGGRVLFTGSTDFTIRSWNIYKGTQLKVFEGHQGSVICMTCGFWSGRSTIDMIFSLRQMQEKCREQHMPLYIAFIDLTTAFDLVVNKIIYSGSSDHTGRAWVAEFGDCTRIYKGHKHTVSVIKVYEGMVFTASGDGSVRRFDARTATLLNSYVGHTTQVTALEVVEGKLFTSSYDGTLNVWDVRNIDGENRPPAIGGPQNNNNNDKGKQKMNEVEKFGGLQSTPARNKESDRIVLD